MLERMNIQTKTTPTNTAGVLAFVDYILTPKTMGPPGLSHIAEEPKCIDAAHRQDSQTESQPQET